MLACTGTHCPIPHCPVGTVHLLPSANCLPVTHHPVVPPSFFLITQPPSHSQPTPPASYSTMPSTHSLALPQWTLGEPLLPGTTNTSLAPDPVLPPLPRDSPAGCLLSPNPSPRATLGESRELFLFPARRILLTRNQGAQRRTWILAFGMRRPRSGTC